MSKIIFLLFAFSCTLIAQAREIDKPLTVGILLYPGVQIIDFTGPYEIFGWAGYTVKTLSEDGKPVITNMNLTVIPDYNFANAPAFDIVLIPGGHEENARTNPNILQWLSTAAKNPTQIFSVCTGAFIVAEAGLLNDRSATTFYAALDNLKAMYPRINVVGSKRFVDNGNVITSAGLSSGIDAALYLVGKNDGMEKARSIATALEYAWHPATGYVRGNMADSHLQKIRAEIPRNIQFEKMYAYGNETEWFEAYRINETHKRTMTIKKLTGLINNSIGRTGEWTATDNVNNYWTKITNDSTWRLQIRYTYNKDNQTEMHIHLYQL